MAATLPVWAQPGRPPRAPARAVVAAGAPATLIGTMWGSGAISDCGNGSSSTWSGRGDLNITLSPDPSSLYGVGGQFSGSWGFSGAADGCGVTGQSIDGGGSVSGSVDRFGSLTVQFSGNGCMVTATGHADKDVDVILGPYFDASCINFTPSLSGTITFVATATGHAPAPPNSSGAAGTSTNPTGSVAEPVNTATGNFYLSYTDMSLHGRGLDFVFNRYYNSLGSDSGALGAHWQHSYTESLMADPATKAVIIKEPSGGLLTFTPENGSSYVCRTTGAFDTLARNSDGSFTLTRKGRSKLTFSPTGLLQSVADRNGNTQRLAYTGGGDLTSVTDTVGRVFTMSYDANHRLTSLADPTGRTVGYSYDGNGDLVSVTDPTRGVTKYTYDAAHRMLTLVDARGVTYLQNTYDNSGRVVNQTNALGKATVFAYSSGSTTITDASGNTSRHLYDQALRLVRTIDGAGSSIVYNYDANGVRTAMSDPNGHTTSFTFDARGNTTVTKDASGNVFSSVYDAIDNATSITTRGGQTSTLTYDANGNLLSVKDPLGGITQNTFDRYGQMLTSADAAGNRWQYEYDNAGNRTRVTDGAGRVTTMTYDPLGRLTATTDGLGQTTHVEYDVLDRVVKRVDGLGNQILYAYDASGNLTGVTDANGNVTSYVYDPAGNRVVVTDAMGQRTTYTYDGNNNLVSTVNARGKATAFTYDGANRLTRITDPMGRTRAFTYDAAGNLTTMTDGNGHTNRLTYNSLNRLTGIQYFDGTSVSYAYDADEDRTSMTDSFGTTSFAYDTLKRLTSITRFDGKVVRYGYDAAGRRTSLVYPDGSVVQSQYDGASKLTRITDWNGRKTAYSYDAAGNLTGTLLPSGVVVNYSYDGGDRLIGLSLLNPDASAGSAFSYSLDRTGNRVGMTTDAGTFQYAYDALDRLSSWAAPSGAMTQYTYDASGNRTATTSAAGTVAYTYDDADEMLSAGAASFTYDGNGSRLTKTAGGNTMSYTWDAANRLAGVSRPNGAVQYGYDGEGNRIAQAAGSSGAAYVNDPSGLAVPIREDGTDGSINYVYGVSLVAGIGANGSYYVTGDGTQNTAEVFDDTGALSAVYYYDPWGNLLNPADPLGSKQKYKFAEQAFDAASGLYYMRARYYDPAAGVFLSRDPLEIAATSPAGGTYSYARNNPLRYYDPTGLAAQKPTGPDSTTSECFSHASDLFSARCFDWTKIRDAVLKILQSKDAWLPNPSTGVSALSAILRVFGVGLQAGTTLLSQGPNGGVGVACIFHFPTCTIGNFPQQVGQPTPLQRATVGEDCERGVPGACATLSGALPPRNRGDSGCPPSSSACAAN